jgi:predicted methyltransferase
MRYLHHMDIQTKREILRAAKTEIMRHRWDTFVDDPPSIAQGGKGVIVSGCPTCKKRFGTNTQYLDHLADDVMPVVLRAAFKIAESR